MRFFAWITVCLICLGSMQTGCQPPSGDSRPGTTSVNETSPTASAEVAQPASGPVLVDLVEADLAKLEETIQSKSGQVVVVDIWSTSCAPCMREFPHLVELSRRYPEQVACVSFNVDYIGLKSKPPESYRPAVEEFLKKQQAQLTNLLSAATDEAVLSKFKLESIPAILIYDAEGKLIHTLTDVNTGEDGLTYAGDVIPKVEELLVSGK